MDADLWYLQHRAEAGHRAEQLELGKRYYHGNGVDKDWGIAATLFMAAKNQGCYEAAEYLAQMEVSFEN